MRWLKLLAVLAFTAVAHASVTVTVNVSALSGGTSPGAIIQVTMQNCTNPTIVNVGTPIPQTQNFYPSPSGVATITLYDNVTQVACNGNLLSYYSFNLISLGTTTFIKNVELPPGNFNLSNLANVTTPPFNPGIIQGPPGVVLPTDIATILQELPTCQAAGYFYAPFTNTCSPGGSGTTTNALTFDNSGAGAVAGTTFNGALARTISYNTIGAQQALTLTTTGTSGAATLAGGSLNIPNYSSGGSLSGMTAGQVPIAASATTVTSSKPIAGAGAGLVSGPTTVVSGNIPVYNTATGDIADSGRAPVPFGAANSLVMMNPGGTSFTTGSTLAASIQGVPGGTGSQVATDTDVANAVSNRVSAPASVYGGSGLLQALVNTVDTAGGGTIYLGPGTYTGAITLPEDLNCVNLIGVASGAGANATHITVASSSSAVLFKGNTTVPYGCIYRDLDLQGNFQATNVVNFGWGKGWDIEHITLNGAVNGNDVMVTGDATAGAHFYEAIVNDIRCEPSTSDYSAANRPTNCVHVMPSGTDSRYSNVVSRNMANATIKNDGTAVFIDFPHGYGTNVAYSPSYIVDTGGQTHINFGHLDTAAVAGINVRGNLVSVMNSKCEWAFAITGAVCVQLQSGVSYFYSSGNDWSGISVNSSTIPVVQLGTLGDEIHIDDYLAYAQKFETVSAKTLAQTATGNTGLRYNMYVNAFSQTEGIYFGTQPASVGGTGTDRWGIISPGTSNNFRITDLGHSNFIRMELSYGAGNAFNSIGSNPAFVGNSYSGSGTGGFKMDCGGANYASLCQYMDNLGNISAYTPTLATAGANSTGPAISSVTNVWDSVGPASVQDSMGWLNKPISNTVTDPQMFMTLVRTVPGSTATQFGDMVGTSAGGVRGCTENSAGITVQTGFDFLGCDSTYHNFIVSLNGITRSAAFWSGVNSQTGTSYTVQNTDDKKLVTLTNSAAVAVTLPVPTTSGFGPGSIFTLLNLGSGIVTVTPTSSTINGAASIPITFGESLQIYSDGTNYEAVVGTGLTPVFTGIVKAPQFAGTGSAPTIAVGAAAGTSPGTPTVTGTNVSGVITVITGTSPTTGAVLATVTFSGTLAQAPQGCRLFPRNSASAAATTTLWTNAPTTNTFTLNTGAGALTGTTPYSWSYDCS